MRLDVCRAAGVTFNDIVLAAAAGSIRRHLEVYSPSILSNETVVRSLMPFAMGRSEESIAKNPLRNRWTFCSVALPVRTISRAR